MNYQRSSENQPPSEFPKKRVAHLVDKLTEIAKQSYCAVKKTSPILEEVPVTMLKNCFGYLNADKRF